MNRVQLVTMDIITVAYITQLESIRTSSDKNVTTSMNVTKELLGVEWTLDVSTQLVLINVNAIMGTFAMFQTMLNLNVWPRKDCAEMEPYVIRMLFVCTLEEIIINVNVELDLPDQETSVVQSKLFYFLGNLN